VFLTNSSRCKGTLEWRDAFYYDIKGNAQHTKKSWKVNYHVSIRWHKWYLIKPNYSTFAGRKLKPWIRIAFTWLQIKLNLRPLFKIFAISTTEEIIITHTDYTERAIAVINAELKHIILLTWWYGKLDFEDHLSLSKKLSDPRSLMT
jgi:hypothetical protein